MARRRVQRVSEQLELEIDGISHDGRGLARREGKRVFIQGALPGEQVLAEITRRRKRFDEGRVQQVLRASPSRVEPQCLSADRCGGCSQQHLDAAEQISLKQAVLLEQLEHFGGLKPDKILPPVTGPYYGYRRKARLGVRYVVKREEVLVGFREKGNSFIADIEQCPVMDRRIGSEIINLRLLLGTLDAYRLIPQIEVAMGDSEAALVFRHLEPLTENDQAALVEFGKHRNIHIYLQPGGVDTVHKIWPDDNNERLSYALDEFGLEMRFHVMDFTQVNPHINKQVVSRAVSYLSPQPEDRILDLFCGLGNFTLPLARSGAHVTGVEGSAAMVERGYENAALNKLENVEFYAADLFKSIQGAPWFNKRYNKLLIDPPRTGALEVVSVMKELRPEKIVYVSCNPATLARDVGVLSDQGYSLDAAGVMDMFPHTTHVESIAILTCQ